MRYSFKWSVISCQLLEIGTSFVGASCARDTVYKNNPYL